MTKLKFFMNLPAEPDKLINVATDYENFPKFLKHNFQGTKIIERNDNETITEDILSFQTIRHTITQRSIHKIKQNEIETKVISGPFKGTILSTLYEKNDNGTKVTVNIDLKMKLYYRILTPLVKKWYKGILTGVLYKMNKVALENS